MKLALIAIFLLLQQPAPEGKAESCNNHHDTPKAHRCDCQRATKCKKDQSQAEDPKCKTYCVKSHCHCVDPCMT
jgi:hypothetical protein